MQNKLTRKRETHNAKLQRTAPFTEDKDTFGTRGPISEQNPQKGLLFVRKKHTPLYFLESINGTVLFTSFILFGQNAPK